MTPQGPYRISIGDRHQSMCPYISESWSQCQVTYCMKPVVWLGC